MQTLIDKTNDRLMKQLIDSTKDAKLAPEIAAWLVCGPLPLSEIIAMRRERLLAGRSSTDHADFYAAPSALYDLGRVTGIGGPVKYHDGLLWLEEEYRQVILNWIRQDQFRRAGLVDTSAETTVA